MHMMISLTRKKRQTVVVVCVTSQHLEVSLRVKPFRPKTS